MKALVIPTGLLFLSGLALAAQGKGRDSLPKTDHASSLTIGQVTVLSPNDKPNGRIEFCSRSSVSLSGYWTPKRADVATCDALAGEYLGPSTKRLPRAFREYHRQYLGIERNGRRLLYLNAYFSHNVLGAKRRKELVNACDGGDLFWGLVCDASSRSISEFEKNGSI